MVITNGALFFQISKNHFFKKFSKKNNFLKKKF